MSPDKSNIPEKSIQTVKDFLSAFKSIVVDDEIAEKCGEIRHELEKAGTPIGPYDLIIAATGVITESILVTNNIKEFARVKGLEIQNWV